MFLAFKENLNFKAGSALLLQQTLCLDKAQGWDISTYI